jgi:DNA-binding CsgD family transcriptional regulator
MGRPATGERKYEIQNIWDTHREIMRLLVAGMHHVDIARELGVTPATISNVMNSAICKRQMNLMRDARDLDAVDVSKRIQEIAPVALQTLEELLCTGNDNVKLKTATDLLDRAGHAAVKTLRTESLSVHLTADDIAEIKSRAKQVGLCVDAEISESAMVNNLPQLAGAL